MLATLLAASLSFGTLQGPPPGQEQDPEQEPRRQARATAAHYEAALRRYAPDRPGFGDDRCEEVVGRFCLRFPPRHETPPDTVPEPPEVEAARSAAIVAHRAWFDVAPEREEAAGSLVRYLVEAGAAPEAVSVAREHARARDRHWASLLLLGLALQEAGSSATDSVFTASRSGMPASARERVEDVAVLLEPGERRRYAGLSAEARRAYERRFWRFADPSLLEPGNERRSAHYARHAWSRILAAAPAVAGRVSWAEDTEELVIRYGVPVHRRWTRPPPARTDLEASLVEYSDRHALRFVPPALLTEGLPPEPEPGEEPWLEREAVRSSYAPVRLHRAGGLAVQAARVPAGPAWLLVVNGRLPPDSSVGPAVAPRGVLAVLDTLGRVVRRRPASVTSGPDGSTWVRAAVPVAPGRWVYRLEVADEATGRLGLAQHPVTVEAGGRPVVSDLLVADPGGAEPAHRDELVLRDLVVPADGAIRVWAEARSLSRSGRAPAYEVEWWVEPADPVSLLGRVGRWLAGLAGAREGPPVRVRWEGAADREPVPLSLVLDLGGLETGLYRLHLEVRDPVSGAGATASRLIRVAPTAPPPPPPSRAGAQGGAAEPPVTRITTRR